MQNNKIAKLFIVIFIVTILIMGFWFYQNKINNLVKKDIILEDIRGSIKFNNFTESKIKEINLPTQFPAVLEIYNIGKIVDGKYSGNNLVALVVDWLKPISYDNVGEREIAGYLISDSGNNTLAWNKNFLRDSCPTRRDCVGGAYPGHDESLLSGDLISFLNLPKNKEVGEDFLPSYLKDFSLIKNIPKTVPSFIGEKDNSKITWFSEKKKDNESIKYVKSNIGAWLDCLSYENPKEYLHIKEFKEAYRANGVNSINDYNINSPNSVLTKTGETNYGESIYELNYGKYPKIDSCFKEYTMEYKDGEYKEALPYSEFIKSHPIIFLRPDTEGVKFFVREEFSKLPIRGY